MAKVTHGMVFAAGLGKRMLPLTATLPKPLVKIANKTMLDHALDSLRASGVKHIVVNSHHLHEQIDAHVKNMPDVTISYEPVLLETGGGLVKALPHLGSNPIAISNGDTVCIDSGENTITRLANALDDATDITMLMVPLDKAFGYHGAGDFVLKGDGTLIRPAEGEKRTHVFAGVQVLRPQLLKGFKEEPFSLNVLYKNALQPDGSLARIKGIEHVGHWLHIGTVADIELAENYLAKI